MPLKPDLEPPYSLCLKIDRALWESLLPFLDKRKGAYREFFEKLIREFLSRQKEVK